MKRGMVGGAHRGPVGLGRQRRTIRLVQGILVLLAAGFLLFAGYSAGKRSGFDAGRRGVIDSPRRPSSAQTVVLSLLGLAALGSAFALQGEGGGVRLLTPARLLELERAGELGPQEPEEEVRPTRP